MYGKIGSFLLREKRQKNLYIATVLMFAFLVVEKLASGLTLTNYSLPLSLEFSFELTDIICLGVYISVMLMLIAKAQFKMILIPDSFLFAVKLYAFGASVYNLVSVAKIGTLAEISFIESVVEGFLFALFLAVLFIGKLASNKKVKHNAPIACLAILLVCLPVTVGFEVAKVFVEESVGNYAFGAELFLFIKGVANEIFLDLPYALLVLLMFFVPEKNIKHVH